MARRSFTSQLYRAARASASGRAVRTGNVPRRQAAELLDAFLTPA